MGSLALSRHQFHDALDWGSRARALNPAQARIYGVIGDAQIELGQYPEAIATFQKMVDLRPDLSSYSRVSYARELYGDLDGAIEMMQKAIIASGPYPENSSYLRVQLSGLYFTKGDVAAAEQEGTRALMESPGYAPALAALAKIDAAKGNFLVAIGRLQQAVNQTPLPEFVILLGDVQEAAGKNDDAARSFDLAHVQERLQQANGVDVDMELALFDADHRVDLPGTIARARAALERRPSIRAQDALAWSLAQNGDDAAAQPLIQQALRLGTQDPLMLFHAGMIAYHLGDTTTARTYLERVMALNPQFSVRYAPLARQILITLRGGG
jgi:tetratricopeptide (TPR) repeat protein